MGYTVIAPLGDNVKALYVGIKEFPTDELYLLTPKSRYDEAKEVEKKLELFSIPVYIIETKEELMESMFFQFSKILKGRNEDDVVVNVASGDKVSSCVALSAAYANGLKAFGISENESMLFPVMKLSYYKELNDTKNEILKALDDKDYISIADISRKTGLGKSLISYHLNGTKKYKGLLDLRLVDVKEDRNKNYVKLSNLGNLLAKGYLKK